jgi:OOP family OmpA-OmpF porin
MKKRMGSAALVLFFGLAAGAWAQGYIGASAGLSKIESNFCEGLSACDKEDTGFKLVGGFELAPNFALEAAYFDLGKATGSIPLGGFGSASVSGKADGYGLFAVGMAPLTNQFSIHGRVGIASIKSKLSASLAGFSNSESERNENVAFGFGAAFALNKNASIRAEWDRFKTEVQDAKSDVDLFSLGAVFRF